MRRQKDSLEICDGDMEGYSFICLFLFCVFVLCSTFVWFSFGFRLARLIYQNSVAVRRIQCSCLQCPPLTNFCLCHRHGRQSSFQTRSSFPPLSSGTADVIAIANLLSSKYSKFQHFDDNIKKKRKDET